MCTNIDDFNRGAALILARLYGSFPVPGPIDCTRIDAHDDLDIPEQEREVRIKQRHVTYSETVQFLADEGFVRYSSRMAPRSSYFDGVVLSSKGLSALSKAPPLLGENRRSSIGDLLIDAGKEVAKEAVKSAVRYALSGGMP